VARDEDSRVYFLQPKRVMNSAVYELRSDDVAVILQRPWLNGVLGLAWYLRRGVDSAKRHVLLKPWRAARKLWRMTHNQASQSVRTATARAYYGSEFRRSVAAHPVAVGLPDDRRKEAEVAALKLGLAPGMDIVTLHIRESGFKPDRRPMEDARNADIGTYFEAIDFLTSGGFTVVRIGDASMTPVRRDGLVDLAASSERTDLLELWCVMESRFFMCCDSGAYHLGPLTGTPTLQVNVIDPILCYPMRGSSMFMPKRFANRATESVFSLGEMVTPEHYGGIISELQAFERTKSYDIIDNTPEELRDAVVEMLAHTQGDKAMTAEQNEFHGRMLDLCEALSRETMKRAYWERRFGPGELFLGEGAIVDSFAKRHLNSSGRVVVPRKASQR
jgi:putative glycosyltransferase (TIGR04372 family)